MRAAIIDYIQSGVLGFMGTVAFMVVCSVARALLDRWMPPRRGPRG